MGKNWFIANILYMRYFETISHLNIQNAKSIFRKQFGMPGNVCPTHFELTYGQPHVIYYANSFK